MVSVKERARLARLFDKQQEHITNQKNSIDRLVSLNIILVAALSEIALSEEPLSETQARNRAQAALDEADGLAAAYNRIGGESSDEAKDGESPTLSEEDRNE